MEVCVFSVFLLCVCVYVTLQLIRFIAADADLTLLWAAAVGKRPGVALRQKVVWITGASSGIGEELAYQLSASGARLVLSARRENELHRVKRKCLELSSLEDEDILVLPLDLLDRSSHREKTDAVLQHFSKIDVLVNNSGRSQRGLFLNTDIDVYSSLMELNYLGTVSITQHVLQHMIHHGDGIIATVSSIAGLVGAPLSSGYAASKHAIQGFFNTLRTELTDYPNITISTICPGPVVSQIVHNAFSEQVNKPLSNAGDQYHKMSTERCVRLILAGLSNRVKEMWIAQQPFLLVFYLWQYTPTLAWYITSLLGRKRVQNFKAGLDADTAYFTKPKAKTS
ncbi:dehydrogenase/reductase SDR family member 7 isoform X2 [Hemibagrus wyckioides]|uniref:dehydrogenase/reductase SDR family member 7 isoform X2 n=1 Tax=Hemibagrus wyckioides TaxID=337641 RepID=UPI00266CC456|nr:dehydrogenase/reductase SDR family member 7 isoform X2 [Hemibagrus wyckioides]